MLDAGVEVSVVGFTQVVGLLHQPEAVQTHGHVAAREHGLQEQPGTELRAVGLAQRADAEGEAEQHRDGVQAYRDGGRHREGLGAKFGHAAALARVGARLARIAKALAGTL